MSLFDRILIGLKTEERSMAWIMRRIISSPVNWTKETIQEMLRANASVVDHFSSLSPDHPDFIKKGDAPSGRPIPFPDRPYEAFMEKLDEPLPDALTSSIVNDRIRNAVEAIEPGVHQFIPTIVTMPDGSRDEGWWAMRQCHRVDAIILDQCEDVHKYCLQPEAYPDWYYYRSQQNSLMKVAIRKQTVAGMAIWYDWRFQKDFFCDDLGQYFLDHGILGYRLRPEDDLNRSNRVAEI